MGAVVVNVAEAAFSQDSRETLHAPSLGCCACVSLYDPQAKAGGVVICVLPDSSQAGTIDPADYPFMFTDLAITTFLHKAVEKGIQPDKATIVLAGCGQISGQSGDFDLGRHNAGMALAVLDQFGLVPANRHVGGALNRSLSLEVRTGLTRITARGRQEEGP